MQKITPNTWKTCWLITESTYQINGLMDYILHLIASNQIENIQVPIRIWKKCHICVASQLSFGCDSNGLSDWMNSLTIFRRVWDFLIFFGLGLFGMHLANKIYCTQSWVTGQQAHKIVCVIISYSGHTFWKQEIKEVCFLKKTKLYEYKNLNLTRELASYITNFSLLYHSILKHADCCSV